MKKILLGAALAIAGCLFVWKQPHAKQPPVIELHIVAGQSNAEGHKGDAAGYPADTAGVDASIQFCDASPIVADKTHPAFWRKLGPRHGHFKLGHFGPEITFARSLREIRPNVAIFKFAKDSSSLAKDWRGPGEGGLYDAMVSELRRAMDGLKQKGKQVSVTSLVWIQGESDAETAEMAAAYQQRLERLLADLRRVVAEPEMPIVLSLDEQHPWVKEHPQVVVAQEAIAAKDPRAARATMLGLAKADTSHLTPEGLIQQGRRLFETYQKLATTNVRH